MIQYCEKEAQRFKFYRGEIEHYVNVMHEDIVKMEEFRFKDRET